MPVLFLSLPDDILRTIPQCENNQDDATKSMALFSNTCRKLHTLFKSTLTQKRTETLSFLLEQVTNANYPLVEEIVARHPKLIFAELNAISPLKLAFYLYDSRMWKMFFKVIYASEKDVQLFFKQKNEQQTHISLTDLSNAYKKVISNLKEWIWQTEDITSSALIDAYTTLHHLQCNLPAHLFKEFTRTDQNWITSSFCCEQIKPPSTCEVTSFESIAEDPASDVTIVHDLQSLKTPSSFFKETDVLVRGTSIAQIACCPIKGGSVWLPGFKDDYKTFAKLYAQREKEYRDFTLEAVPASTMRRRP